MAENADYYVYVYIDPRNNEEFYYGQGRGSRKDDHLKDRSDNEKTRRIAEIHAEGLEPIIRVIARWLTEAESLLVEKTLLWKLGKWTTNIATGHFADKFRPHNTLHKELFGFDFQNSLYYYNVGENEARNWDDYVKYGFISAGWGARYRDAMRAFNKGDIVAAYLKRYGFVGIGRVHDRAKMIRDVRINGEPLLKLPLNAVDAGHDCDDPEQCEWVCPVKWLKRFPREKAKWNSSANLYTTPLVKASLDGQPDTVKFLEEEFAIRIRDKIK